MLNRSKLSGPAMVLAGGLAVLLAGCDNGGGALGPNEGRVRFVLSSGADVVASVGSAELGQSSVTLQDGAIATNGGDGDRPRHFFQSANVTLSSVLARNTDGVLVNVEMDLPVTVDVVMLDDGKQVTLPDGILPPATYDQVVLVMTHLEVVTLDGTGIAITPPGGGWTTIVPICPFDVEDGGSTTVSLQFMLGQAFSWRIGGYHFQPRLSCDAGDTGDGTGT